MKCKNCQKELGPDFKMCPYCGERVEAINNNKNIKNSEENAKPLTPAAIEALRVKKELEEKFNLQNHHEEASDIKTDEIEEDENEQIEEEPKQKKIKTKRSFNIKGLLIALTMLIIVAAGVLGYFYFNGSPLNQNVKEIEAGTIYDPLDLVSLGSKDADKYSYEVAEDTININVPAEYTITYTLTNTDTNKSKDVIFKFNVVDTTPPEITAEDTIKATVENEFNILSIITVTDKVDGVIDTKNVSVQGTVDTNTVGTYALTLTVSDKAGNKAAKTVNVAIEDMGDPDIFFNNILGSWVNHTTKIVYYFSLKNGEYFLNIGRYQSEGYGEGALSFVDVNGDNTNATFDWGYYTYSEETVTSSIVKKTVVVDTGVAKDNKISIDIGDGKGLQEYQYYDNK